MAKRKAVKLLKATVFNEKGNPWTVHFGRLNPGPGNPGSARLFQVLGEKLPFEALNSVRKYLKTKRQSSLSFVVLESILLTIRWDKHATSDEGTFSADSQVTRKRINSNCSISRSTW